MPSDTEETNEEKQARKDAARKLAEQADIRAELCQAVYKGRLL